MKLSYFSQLVTAIEANAILREYFVYVTITDGKPEDEMGYLEHLSSLNVDEIQNLLRKSRNVSFPRKARSRRLGVR